MLDDSGNVVGTSKVAARHVCRSAQETFYLMLKFFRCSFVALLTDVMDSIDDPEQNG